MSSTSTDDTNEPINYEEEIIRLRQRLQEESTKNSILSNEVNNLKRELNQANGKISMLENAMSAVRSSFDTLMTELISLKKQCTLDEARVKKLDENTNILSIETVNMKSKINENNMIFTQCDERIHSMNSSLAELDLRQQILENTNTGGRFIWKIDHLKNRMKQSVQGKMSSLHSAPCFTKRFGYKFCTYLYLNGDGAGKDTHVSLFIVIMKSEYDALLEWPFRQKVTFNLLNHENKNDSVKKSIMPDANSPSFKRPRKEMNLAAGFPLFVSKERLENFVVDDSIFIETSVGES